ncbi:MAG: hypothetical protein IJI44_04300 [Erysipelotrichaceae bacterium]|nr:hypothetical protein [Erysipelotrichaceae bacterium]
MLFKKKKIDTFERIDLRISGMRYMQEYEIVAAEEGTELLFYENGYQDENRVPQSRIRCDREEILNLLNSCDILCWDGFFGKHPRYVSDGEMFLFTAIVDEGKKIRAEGSENFPKHFSEFRKGLREILEREDEE